MIRRTYLYFAFILAGACGGGGGGGEPAAPDPRIAVLESYQAQSQRIVGDAATGRVGMPAATNVPVMGSMTMTGSGIIRVEAATGPIALFGDATLNIDFADGTATGDITRLFGTGDSGLTDYDGSLGLNATDVGATFGIGYAGTLTNSDIQLNLDGTMQATLRGNPVSALSAADMQARVDMNGTVRDGSVILTLDGTANP